MTAAIPILLLLFSICQAWFLTGHRAAYLENLIAGKIIEPKRAWVYLPGLAPVTMIGAFFAILEHDPDIFAELGTMWKTWAESVGLSS